MAENGLDLRTWLTVIGVFALFFGYPAAAVAFDLRKARRSQADRARTATMPTPPPTDLGAGTHALRSSRRSVAPNSDVEGRHR